MRFGVICTKDRSQELNASGYVRFEVEPPHIDTVVGCVIHMTVTIATATSATVVAIHRIVSINRHLRIARSNFSSGSHSPVQCVGHLVLPAPLFQLSKIVLAEPLRLSLSCLRPLSKMPG